jgi:hypothetical protein
MNSRSKLAAVRQIGASRVNRGRLTKKLATMNMMSAISRIIALMMRYFAALEDVDCIAESPTL